MPLSFPARLAAIDIGSNAIRMLVADFIDTAKYLEVEQHRLPVRLGHDVFDHGELTPLTLNTAVQGLRRFSDRMEKLRVAQYRAVATSAVRDSRNGGELVQRARQLAAINIGVITGAEEARLVHRAVRNRVRLDPHRWLLADLGGGSLEVSVVDQHHVLDTQTYPVGSVRLLEGLEPGYHPDDVRALINERAATIRDSPVMRTQVEGFVATGGNIEALARLARAKTDDAGVFTLPVKQLRETTHQLAQLTYEQRIAQLGLREDRADVILPAAIVYEWLAEVAASDSLIVPAVGLKEGVLWEIVEAASAN